MNQSFIVILVAILAIDLQAVVITFQVKYRSPIEPPDLAEVKTEFSALGEHILTQSATDPQVYVGTFVLPDTPNGYIRYRFSINEWERRMGWSSESEPGRVVFLTNSTIVLPLATYGRLDLTNRVTFQVDLRADIERGSFIPDADRVYLYGNFNDGRETFMPKGPAPGLYSVTIPLLTMRPGDLLRFYFAVNFDQIEPTEERVVKLAGGTQIIPPFYFGNVLPSTEAGVLSIGPVINGKTTLSWLGAPGLFLQTNPTTQSNSWSTLPATDNQSSAEIAVTESAQFFRLIR